MDRVYVLIGWTTDYDGMDVVGVFEDEQDAYIKEAEVLEKEKYAQTFVTSTDFTEADS